MAQEDSKTSRRARRRAQQAAEVSTENEDAEDEAAPSAEAEDEAVADGKADEADGAGVETPKRKKKKKKKKRAPKPEEAEEEAESEEAEDDDGEPARGKKVLDRNQRVREQAAARRRAKREKERAVEATGLDASEMVDDAVARGTDKTIRWIRKNFRWVQWVVIAVVVGGIGWQVYSWRTGKAVGGASDTLMTGVLAEQGRIGAPEDEGKPDENGVIDPLPIFRTEEERTQAAEEAYRKAGAMRGEKSGTTVLATLGLAGVLYDQGKYSEAKTEYEKVESSSIAAKDEDIKARATEGIGLCLEATGDLDGAIKAFRALENTDVAGLKELGMFHQARLLHAQDKKDEAVELLKKVIEKVQVKDPSPQNPPSYLEQVSRTLLDDIDPAVAAELLPQPPGGLGAGAQEQLQEMIEKLKKQAPPSEGKGGGDP